MLVEFTGGTGTGKTSLAHLVKQRLCEAGLDGSWARRRVPYSAFIGKFSNEKLQNAFLDVLMSRHARLAARRYTAFLRFANEINKRHADSLGVALNVKRSMRRKFAIHHYMRQQERDRQIVFVDEGTTHIAHNLFVQVKSFNKRDWTNSP